MCVTLGRCIRFCEGDGITIVPKALASEGSVGGNETHIN